MIKIFLSILLFSLTSPIFAQSLTANKVAMTCVSGTISTSAVACDSDITDNSGVSVSVGVPMTASSGITANITGNVVGNLNGNVTGNLTGSASQLNGQNSSYYQTANSYLSNIDQNLSTGSIPSFSSVTASLTGNVTGNVTGNAGTVTNGLYTSNIGTSANNVVAHDSSGDIEDAAWQDYSASSTIVGWGSLSTKQIYYKKVGKTVFIAFALAGTSNSTSATFTVPYTQNSSWANMAIPIIAVDNSLIVTTSANLQIVSSSTIQMYTFYPTGAWTASGTKTIFGQFWYQTN